VPDVVSNGGGGEVFVHGYYRKDGTYVHSYHRSKPAKKKKAKILTTKKTAKKKASKKKAAPKEPAEEM
jgi:hypothetical protein